jgi:hypothetical protein
MCIRQYSDIHTYCMIHTCIYIYIHIYIITLNTHVLRPVMRYCDDVHACIHAETIRCIPMQACWHTNRSWRIRASMCRIVFACMHIHVRTSVRTWAQDLHTHTQMTYTGLYFLIDTHTYIVHKYSHTFSIDIHTHTHIQGTYTHIQIQVTYTHAF